MPCKVVFFYNLFDAGFSETYYHTSNNPSDVNDELNNALYQAAVKFRYVACKLKAVRISTYDVNPRKSLLIRPYPKAQGTRYASQDIGPDPASTTAVLALRSTQNFETRRIWLRGLSDLDVKRDEFGNDVPSAEIYKMWDAFILKLRQAGLAIRYLQRPPDGGLIWSDIDRVSNVGTENSATHSLLRRAVAGVPYPKGTLLSFRGIGEGLPRFPRQSYVIAPVTLDGRDWFEISYSLPGGKTVVPDKLQYTEVKWALATIGEYDFERFGEHKTGRPFGSLRGRSRAVRRSV